MSLHQFFLDDQVLADEAEASFTLRLSREDAKHARVLRLEAGEHLAVVDASSDYFECEIVGFDGDLPAVRIARHVEAPETGPAVMLVQGLAKGDKMETVIRQGTEIGVAAFVPLRCERSIMKIDEKKVASKLTRWRSIARSAAMQAGRLSVPDVAEPAGIDDLSALLCDATALLVCWEEAPGTALIADALDAALVATDTTVPADARIAVVVGPEGGLSAGEVERLLALNPRSALVSLGSSILRTETAGVIAPALTLYELGALGGRAGNGRA